MTPPNAETGGADPSSCRFYDDKGINLGSKEVRCICVHCHFFREKLREMRDKNDRNSKSLDSSTVVFISQIACATIGLGKTLFFRVQPDHHALNFFLDIVCFALIFAGEVYLKKNKQGSERINETAEILQNFKEIQKYTRMVGSKMSGRDKIILRNESFIHSYVTILRINDKYLRMFDEGTIAAIKHRKDALSMENEKERALLLAERGNPPSDGALPPDGGPPPPDDAPGDGPVKWKHIMKMVRAFRGDDD